MGVGQNTVSAFARNPSSRCTALSSLLSAPTLFVIAHTWLLCVQVYDEMVKQLEVSPAAVQQQQQLLAADPAAVLPPLEPAGGPIAQLPPDQAALVWIQYMRFSRRSESVTASRKVGCMHLATPACTRLQSCACWWLTDFAAGLLSRTAPASSSCS